MEPLKIGKIEKSLLHLARNMHIARVYLSRISIFKLFAKLQNKITNY